jgi:hypothetical protein
MSPPFVNGPRDTAEDRVKVHFDLSQDENGYPPVTSESIWAVPLGQLHFRLDNIPFFVCGVSCFDVILARLDVNGLLKYVRLLETGGHSTLRVLFYESTSDTRPMDERVRELRSTFRNLMCTSELSHIPRLISVDVPPEVNLNRVLCILDAGENQELWEYEEASISHAT